MFRGITEKEFKAVFAKCDAELRGYAKWMLTVAAELPDTRFSASEKAVTFYTEVAYGFLRGNSRSIELNLFVPLDTDLEKNWKESRHTTTKKLGTFRISNKTALNGALKELFFEAHRLSSGPRRINTETREGFLAAVQALRKTRK